MAAATTDKFLEVGLPGSATNLAGSGYTVGATSITVDTTTNWPTDSLVIFGIDVVETDDDGNEVRVDGSYCIFEGIVTSATTIGSVTKLYGDDQSYDPGSNTRVYITISTQQTQKLIDGLMEEHNRDGTHGAVTATSVATDTISEETAGAGVTVDGVLLKDNKVATADAVPSTAIDFGGSGAGVWWEEIGRTTLGSTADTVSVASLPARKYLMVQITGLNSGAITPAIRFNNDTGANYNHKISVSWGAAADTPSTNQILFEATGVGFKFFATAEIINIATEEKLVRVHSVNNSGSAGAANQAVSRETVAKWVNTSSQVTRIDLINQSTGDFAAGTEVVVLGHD